jgi:two-component system cell cycle sensor histidine kinase/response regulator CckA
MLNSPVHHAHSSRAGKPGLCLDPDTDRTGPSPITAATIMVVEDQPLVRALTGRMLRDEGYIVIEAQSAEEALLLLEQDAQVRLVLTDVAMPGMDGVRLADRIQHLYPDQRVMLMSAFVGLIAKIGFRAAPLPVLAKPFTAAQLVQKVREALLEH